MDHVVFQYELTYQLLCFQNPIYKIDIEIHIDLIQYLLKPILFKKIRDTILSIYHTMFAFTTFLLF